MDRFTRMATVVAFIVIGLLAVGILAAQPTGVAATTSAKSDSSAQTSVASLDKSAADVRFAPALEAVTPALTAALGRVISDTKGVLPPLTYFALTDDEAHGDWHFVSLVGFKALPADLSWNAEDADWVGLAVLHQTAGSWQGAVEGDERFAPLLGLVSDNVLSGAAKHNLSNTSPQRPPTTESPEPTETPTPPPSYIFPWESGYSMQYGVKGVHKGNDWGWSRMAAVDLVSDGNTALDHAPNRILAAANSTVSWVCPSDNTSVAVRLSTNNYNEALLYYHFAVGTSFTIGQAFNQGDYLGALRTGNIQPPARGSCGYATQAANTFHLHWAMPVTDTFHADVWSIKLEEVNDADTWKDIAWTYGTQVVRPLLGTNSTCSWCGGWLLRGGDASTLGYVRGKVYWVLPDGERLATNVTIHSSNGSADVQSGQEGRFATAAGQLGDDTLTLSKYGLSKQVKLKLVMGLNTVGGGDIKITCSSVCVRPTAPTNLSIADVDGELELTWRDRATNEDGYRISRSENDRPYQLLATLPPDSSSYRDHDTDCDQRYTYRVEAFNDFGGQWAQATMRVVCPPPPTCSLSSGNSPAAPPPGFCRIHTYTPTPAPPTHTPTFTPQPTATATPPSTATRLPTNTPTGTPIPTATPSDTPTPLPNTPTPPPASPTPTRTPTPTPTASPYLMWRPVPAPLVGIHDELRAVAVAAPNTAWAVGDALDSSYQHHSLLLYWDGSVWGEFYSPSPGSAASLNGVATNTVGNAWAVGSYQDSACNCTLTLVLHFNGSIWTQVASPNPSINSNYLYGIALEPNGDGWAVGGYEDSTCSCTHPLVLRLSAGSWSVVNINSPGTTAYLLSVATYPGGAMAVGSYYDASYHSHNLIMNSSGGSWDVQTTADLGDYNYLSTISASSATDAWAVGFYIGSSASHASSLHWNGSGWSNVPVNLGVDSPRLLGVAAISPTEAWAVGSFVQSSYDQVLLLHWSGGAWLNTTTPVHGTHGCPVQDIAALNSTYIWAAGYCDDQPLLLRYSP